MRMHFEFVEHTHKEDFDIIAVEGAVLIEAKTYPFFDEIWVTKLDKEQAVWRVLERNPNLNEGLARARVQRQISDKERLKYASFSYDSRDPIEDNRRKVDQYMKSLAEKGVIRGDLERVI